MKNNLVIIVGLIVLVDVLVILTIVCLPSLTIQPYSVTNNGNYDMDIIDYNYSLEYLPGQYIGQETYVTANGSDIKVNIGEGMDRTPIMIGHDFIVNCLNTGTIQITGSQGNVQVCLDENGEWPGYTLWKIVVTKEGSEYIASLYYDEDLILTYRQSEPVLSVVLEGSLILTKPNDYVFIKNESLIYACAEVWAVGSIPAYGVVFVEYVDSILYGHTTIYGYTCTNASLHDRYVELNGVRTIDYVSFKLTDESNTSEVIINSFVVTKTISGTNDYAAVAVKILASVIAIILVDALIFMSYGRYKRVDR